MSELDRLISQLCPDGVEYMVLGDIGTITRGNGLPKSDFTESGVGCIHYGQIYTYYGAFADSTKSFVLPELAKQLKAVSNSDIIIAVTSENIEDVCKCVVWLGNEDIVTGGHTAILKHNQNAKYIAYFLQTEDFFRQKCKIAHGTKVIEVTPSKLGNIKIPIPPLPIQREIVRVLDKFTELTAELEARKKQYAYYRNELLTFGDEVPMVALGEISRSISTGVTPLAGNSDYYGGDIPWLRTQEVRFVDIWDTEIRVTERALKETSLKWVPVNCLIVAISGATAGRAGINKIPLTTNQVTVQGSSLK